MISYTELADMQCQEILCDGVRTLNAEEQEHPAICALCSKRMCDACAFGVSIPYDVLGEKPDDWNAHRKRCRGFEDQWGELHPRLCPHDKPTDEQRYDALVCVDCFNEDWV